MNRENVIFGAGPLGCAIAEELLHKGEKVKLVNRSGVADIPAGATINKADATDPEITREVCKGADVVFHCAMPPYTQWPELFPSLTYGIMEGAISTGAKLVYADNLYMYGRVEGPITENLPNNATGSKGKTRAMMAEKLMNAHQDGRLQVTIGRASDFFGPRVINSIIGERIFIPAIENKRINILGRLDQPHTFTYIRDFAKALVILARSSGSYGEIWHVPSARTISLEKFLYRIFKQTGIYPPVKPTPRFLVNFLSMFNPIVKELKEVLPSYEVPFVVDHSKFENRFGNHSTPHDLAIKETVEWFREYKPG